VRSWLHVTATFAALVAAIALAAKAPWWPLRVVAASLEALLLLRAFIVYHDHMHGALLRDSVIGSGIMHVTGVLLLAPPRIWGETHNAHHANTARLSAVQTGTFSLWPVERWRRASFIERLSYRLERHPMTMLLGYFTIFLVAMCVMPFVQNPRRYVTSGLAVVVHVALSAAIWRAFGPGLYVATVVAPFSMACAIGSYLFYAQHNAPGVELHAPGAWTHVDGALAGSTHLVMGGWMRWFTGNIGLHHVHHLNARIPFYRLPEAMAALPELAHPIVTTLRPRDVLACLRLALWEPSGNRMVAFSELRQPAVRERAHFVPDANG
jgi:omega-6 fatty acid desaturase (delta-12 desaturase)